MHSDIIKEDEKHSNHSHVIMLLCLPYIWEGDYIRINKAVTIANYPRIRHIGYKYGIGTSPTQIFIIYPLYTWINAIQS